LPLFFLSLSLLSCRLPDFCGKILGKVLPIIHFKLFELYDNKLNTNQQ
jgi:hypothetical protein